MHTEHEPKPLLLLPAAHTLAGAADLKSNIVFILADDLGWADTTLDAHGAIGDFTRAYSASPLCSPNGS